MILLTTDLISALRKQVAKEAGVNVILTQRENDLLYASKLVRIHPSSYKYVLTKLGRFINEASPKQLDP